MKEKNVETSASKKSKKKLILLLSIIFLLLVSAGVGIAWKLGVLTFGGNSDKCTLYWNVAEQTYLTGAGFSARQVEDDGYYHVTLAVDGEQVEYKVKDKKLVDDIDNRDIMGLEVDKDGVITAVYDPKEVCDGESISEWYVVSVGEDSFKVRQTKGAESGLSYDVKMTENTGIYDVTGAGTVGAKKTLEVNDCVRVFRSFEKEVIYVFVVRGADYFTGNIVQDYCEHCDAQVDWYEWTEKNAVPVTTRHWRLTNDIVLTYQADIKDYQDVVIDLNGHTVEAVERRRVFCVGDSKAQGVLSIVDQSTEGTGTLKTTGEAPHGGIVHIKAGTCNFYSGTMDASETVASSYGLGVYLVSGTTFNMHGGTIIGGTSVGGRKYTSAFIGGGGGAVYVMGTFNMYDGTIRDGKAVAYRNSTGGYHWGIGGNIDVRNAATFNMEGGEILNGTADRSGGNVYVSANSATFTMRGGVISDGRSITSGGASGNVFVGQNSVFQFEDGTIKDGTVYKGGGGNVGVYGTMIMSGGRITGGLSVNGETFETAKKREDTEAHNVFCTKGGVVDMSGGTVDGYMRIDTKECMIKVSGTARITGADYNLSLGTGVEMRIGELTKGAKIGVTGGGFISEKTSSKYLTYLKSDYDEVDIRYYKSKFFMGKLSCLCGGSHVNSDGKVVVGHYGTCDGTILEWMPWGYKANAPTVSGNWYLVADVQLTGQKGVAVDTKMALDLNGHTIKGKEDTRVYYIAGDRNVQMTILDTSEKQTGKIVSHGENKLAGSCLLALPGNEVVMYSGTLDASDFKEIGVGGATLTIRKTTKFTMYGGTLVGGITTKTGGTVVSEGTFVLYDGIIRDGKATMSGGNIYVPNGEFKMLGGKIINGSANYYNAEGKSAGTYDKGVGGNIYIKGPNKDTYVNATITGGTIEGGQSNGRGGNVHAHQYVNLVLGTEKGEVKNAAVISGGESASGGNIFARADSTIAIYDGITIRDGIASSQGGNILFDSNKAFVIAGGIIQNGTAKEGGNMCLSGKLTGAITGGTISGGTATSGGNILNKGALTVSGGTISGGTATSGGSIHTSKTLNISGGTISGGVAVKQGGNIYTTGDITMTGGIITGGKAEAEKPTFEYGIGGNICAAGAKKDKYATVTITGGTIEKGEANGRGGNIDAHTYANLVLGKEDATTNDLVLVTEGKSNATSTSSGGNLFVRGDSTLTIYNGVTVRDGEANYQGGNLLFDSNKEFVIAGGIIQNGTAKQGGNMCLSGKLTGAITGGTISNGYATENGGNILNKGSLTVSGGTITGGTAVDGGSIYTSKLLNVEGGTISNGFATAKGGNIYTTGDITMTGGIITSGKAEAEKPTFEYGIGGNILAAGADKDNYANVTITGGTIEKGEANGRGGNIDAHTFANLVLGTKDATSNELALITEGKSTASSGGSGGNLFVRGDSTLTMYNGVTVRDGEAKNQGGNLMLDSNKQFVMDGGVFEGGTAKDGGSISFSNKFNGTIAGGTISGGTATEEGGNIFNQGTLTVSGGNITGGTAVNGGSIYTSKTLNIEGGIVSDGFATETGGNIYTTGDITMTGGIIRGGKAEAEKPTFEFGIGGNILAAGADKDHYANVTITGGTIEKGEANGRGGNIDAHSFANLVLGTKDAVTNDLVLIAEGKSIESSGATGGNIFARDNSTLVINNGVTVCDGEAKYQGGNIHFDSNKEFSMNGGIVEGGTAKSGGNISFSNRLDGTISGGSIIGGSATEYGGNIYNKGKLLVKDTASVNYGTATNGGNIYNEGTVQVEGAAAGENTTVEPLKTVLKGKNISVLGDSISTYKDISNGDIADTTNSTIKGNKNYYTTELLPSWKETYWGRLVDKYNMNLLVNNSASGGYILTDRSDSQLSGITRCTELHDNTGDNAGTEPDIIAVYLGTNDLIKGTELGELTDATYNAVKAQNGEYITPTTFTEGYIILLDKIVNRYKNADVFCFTLLPTSNSESNKTLLNDYNVRIREIAKHYNVSVVDIASESGITLENYKLLQTGSHPLEAGMSWMADVFERALGTKYGVEISPYIANISKGAATNGGNIYVADNASLVIKSGVIREGYASTDTSNPGMGGNIFNQGTLTVSGGTISGGTAVDGGNIYNQGTLTVSGGTITGGTATNGGNIYLYAVRSDATTGSGATMTMNGGTISDGKATLGGNIYIDRGIFQAEDETYTSTPATMTMSSGTIENGWATGSGSGSNARGGGNIYCVGLFTMKGGTIQGGKAGSSTNTAVIGGNIYVYRGANVKGHVGKIIISAGSILNARATSNRGANIMLDHAEMEIKPTGDIKITGGKKATIDESGVVTSATGVSNVEMYNNPKFPILISGDLFEGSEIGFRINGTISSATTIATINTTTVTQDASTIASFFKSDPTNHEVKGSGTELTYGKKAE